MQKRILIIHPRQHLQADIHRGIRTFAMNQPEWDVAVTANIAAAKQEFDSIRKWEPDGILLIYRYKGSEMFFEIPDIPVVMLDLHHEQPEGVSWVAYDDEDIGRRAAVYFQQKGYRHMAVTMHSHKLWSQLRATGFMRELSKADITAEQFVLRDLGDFPWEREVEEELCHWLQELPKPVAIYCLQDKHALRVLNACKQVNLGVPTEVSILGTDNTERICRVVRPNLSSVPVPGERAGFMVANMLCKQMQHYSEGDRTPCTLKVVSTEPVVERQSTLLQMIPDPAIAKAANHLQDHVLEGGGIEEAAREAGINRRTLEIGFRKYLRTSPGTFQRELKLKHAMQLLTETDLRVWEVAESCRMTHQNLVNTFKKKTGFTPMAYRKRFQLPKDW